jgi:predicted ATPase
MSKELPGEERFYQKYLLAEAYQKLRRPHEGLALTNELFSVMSQTGKRNLQSDLHRLKGDLLLLQDHTPDEATRAAAERSYRDAISVARDQDAKSIELRATMSLARLLGESGRRQEAHTLLDKIYGWFTEGYDTADLKLAEALLDELSV